jgi:hypothetical protein
MAARTEEGCDRAEGRKKSLSLSRRFESTHPALSFAWGRVRVLGSVAQSLVSMAFHAGYDLYLGGGMAAEIVRDDRPWDVLQSLQ